ncbi:hypothetical protein G3T14_16325 [Methylobacterium sp. BTF04]|uniref:hypothetical protein n=1 Tax=Methylobacterium sp. BTF04 TaxID=2708300 RepID=UPI0013D14BBE|nr:hypothetical protein [Methylobacterium sp. BTF04]NEU13687.1 hypothetical protein [Methylobacterium sp. BTF04]
MDYEIAQRLDRQDRVLAAILAALAPPETETEEGSGFDDLVEILGDLTVAVSDVTAAIQALRSEGSERSLPVER